MTALLLAFLCLLAPSVAADPALRQQDSGVRGSVTHAVGTRGATLELGPRWAPGDFSGDDTPDQFLRRVGRGEVYMILREYEDIVDDEADLLENVSAFIDDLGERHESRVEGEPVLERSGDRWVGAQSLEDRYRSLTLWYEVRAIARDGLVYVVIVWSESSRALWVTKEADHAAKNLELPGPDTEWAASARPTRWSSRYEDVNVSVELPASIFAAPATRSDSFWKVESREGELIFTLLPFHDPGTLDIVCDNAVEVGWRYAEELQEIERLDRRVGERWGREVAYTLNDGEDNYVRSLSVLAREDLAIELRMFAIGSFGRRDAWWERVVHSLKIEAALAEDAFPAPPAPDLEEDRTAFQKALRASSTLLGTTPDRPLGWSASTGGDIVWGTSGLHDLGDVTRTVFHDDAFGDRDAAITRGSDDDETIFVTDIEGRTWRFRGGLRSEAEWSASFIEVAPAGGLLLLRRSSLPVRPGLSTSVSRREEWELVHALDDSERVLMSIADIRPVALSARQDAPLALLASTRREADLWGGILLRELNTETGAARSLTDGPWQTVTSIAAGPGFWLVSGTTGAGDSGIFRLKSDASRELLLAGRMLVGLGIRTGSQLVLCDLGLVTDNDLLEVRAMELDTLPEVASHMQRLSGSTLARVARAALGELGLASNPAGVFDDATLIRRFVAAADRACLQHVGGPLPLAPDDIDHLAADEIWNRPPDAAVRALVAALLSQALLREGAEWIPTAGEVADSRQGTPAAGGSNTFAVAFDPLHVVHSVANPDSAWWAPTEMIRARSEGRTVLLGRDPDALKNALDERALKTDLQTLELEQLQDLFAAHAKNVYLRRRAYEALSHAGRLADIERLAAAHAGESAPDQIAQLGAQVALATASGDHASAPGLVERLRSALEEHPREADLYLVLGQAYELREEGDDTRRARACYQQALSLAGFGAAAEHAQARLDALSD